MSRPAILEHAAAVLESRAEAYGPANASLRAIAMRWSLTLGQPVTPAQVALCMIDLKMVRLAHDPVTATASSMSSAMPH
jgi:hypothetical protein